MFNKNLDIDTNTAYFIGILHSDGCIYRFVDKKRKRTHIRLSLSVAEKSLPMAKKFQKIFFDSFGRTVNLRKKPDKNLYVIQTSINRLYDLFERWEGGVIPPEICENPSLFGAYLAGYIDGDGSIKLKKHKTKDKYIACVIRIASGKALVDLLELIRFHLNCEAHFYKTYNKKGSGYDNCFHVSSKNFEYVHDYLLPHLALDYKRKKINYYIKEYGPSRI